MSSVSHMEEYSGQASWSPDSYLNNTNESEFQDRRQIGNEALSWKLSSAKPGHGVEQLRDNDLSTFWQSDGMSPHRIEIDFDKKQKIDSIGVYCDFKLDESYTPEELRVRAATSVYESEIVGHLKLDQPNGWVNIKLKPHSKQLLGLNKYYKQKEMKIRNEIMTNLNKNNKNDNNNNNHSNASKNNKTKAHKHLSRKPKTPKHLKTKKLIIEIVSSHQQGRDTHIRQIKVWGPRNYSRVVTQGMGVGLASQAGKPGQHARQDEEQRTRSARRARTANAETKTNMKQRTETTEATKRGRESRDTFAIDVPKNIQKELEKELKRLGLLASVTNKDGKDSDVDIDIDAHAATEHKRQSKMGKGKRSKKSNRLVLKTTFGTLGKPMAEGIDNGQSRPENILQHSLIR